MSGGAGPAARGFAARRGALRNRTAVRSLALLAIVLCLAPMTRAAQAASDGPPAQAAVSRWYLERGSARRDPPSGDALTETAFALMTLLRNGSVPGFYDGQFAALSGRGAELAVLAHEPDAHHVLRVMAVMALQEAERGQRLAELLEPLVLPAGLEFQQEFSMLRDTGRTDEPEWIAQWMAADLSRHARFALAKSGQTRLIREKLDELERYVVRRLDRLLDPDLDSDTDQGAFVGRALIFDIAYHYQQFDDFDSAAGWFRQLTANLPGMRETRWAHYNLACIAALRGQTEVALAELWKAWEVGFGDVAWLLEDGDLRSLHGQPEFNRLVATLRNLPEADAPAATEPEAPAAEEPGTPPTAPR